MNSCESRRDGPLADEGAGAHTNLLGSAVDPGNREDVYQYLGIEAVFASAKSKALLDTVRRLAPLNAAVLIEGESGSGKEVLARALHAESDRASRPWVDLSCAALPEQLVESELFGYEKGAFSGANSRKEGLFELAHTGTLFLDEIGELPAGLQAKLLRVLDCGSYYRLGGTKKVQVDVRIVAATNRSLREATGSGEFRKDLYHRLAQIRLQAIPLRERPDDIVPIAELFLSYQSRKLDLSAQVRAALTQYSWPGNARELRNAIVSASAMSTGDTIQFCDLSEEVQAAYCELGGVAGTGGIIALTEALRASELPEPSFGLLEQLEKKAILEVLQRSNGHQERAAKLLGISSKTLSRKLKLYLEQGHERTPTILSA
jgi:transcriptional regulator with PAS, ATPase and Fis domain